MAHVCTACGFDCSRLRAPPDPEYGLPLVVCPGCGRASVRRKLRAFWTRSNPDQLIWACGNLAMRVLSLLALSAIAVGVVALSAGVAQAGMAPARSQRVFESASTAWNFAFAGVLLAAGSLLSALGLRWVLGHLGRGRRTLAYVGCAAVLMWGLPNLFGAADSFFTVGPRFGWEGATRPAPRPFAFDIGHWMWPIMLVAVGVLVWSLGGTADRFGRYTRQQAWLTRLAKARRRRARRRS